MDASFLFINMQATIESEASPPTALLPRMWATD